MRQQLWNKITLKSFAVDFIIALGSFEKKTTKSCSHLMYYSANLDKDDSYLDKKRLKSLSVPNAAAPKVNI